MCLLGRQSVSCQVGEACTPALEGGRLGGRVQAWTRGCG